jgi:hypothetical protein
MDLDRREFARVLGAGALAMASGARPEVASPPGSRQGAGTVTLELELRGGYVYVIERTNANTGTVEFGAVRRPKHSESESEHEVFQQHELLLVLQDGESSNETKIPNLNAWVLTGRDVTFASGPNEQPAPVALPPKVTSGSVQGLDKLPNILEQAKKSDDDDPKFDRNKWAERLNGRVTLSGGALTVREPSVNREPATLRFGKPHKPDEDGRVFSDTLQYTLHSTTGEIHVLVKGHPAITLLPKQGSDKISAVIMPLLDPTYKHPPKHPIEHFAMFYRFLDDTPKVKNRRVPHTGESTTERTPGIFCPPGLYEM